MGLKFNSMSGQNGTSNVFQWLGFIALMVITYIALQPSIFGPATNTFAKGMETHALLTQLLRYVNEFSQFGDPVVRMWHGEFDIHHNPHMNVRYPFYFTWLGEYGDLLSSNKRVFLITHLHHIIGGVGAFIFAKSIGTRNISAFVAGLFFAFCLSNTYMSPFFTRMAASNWTPWCLAAVWLAASGKSPRLAIIIGAPSVALLAFASSAQPLLYFVVTAAFVGLAAIYTGYQTYGKTRQFVYRCIYPSIALTILSLFLAIPATLPVLLEQSEYVRWTTDGPVYGSYKVSYEATLLQYFKGADGLINPFVPVDKYFNVGSTFIGPIFAFVFLAVFAFKKNRFLAISMFGISIYFIINGMGAATFLPKITYQIPGLNNVRQLTSHYAVVNFAVIALIALCIDYLIENREKHRLLIIGTSVLSIILLAVMLNAGPNELDKIPDFYRWSLFSVPILIVVFVFLKNQRLQTALLVLLGIAIILPAAGLRTKETISNNKTLFYKVEAHKDVLKSWERIAELQPNAIVAANLKSEDKKFHARRITSSAIFSGLRPHYAIMSPRPIDSFKYTVKLNHNSEKLVDRGVQYFITNQPDRKYNPNLFEFVETIGEIDIYKSKNPKGRLNLACTVLTTNSECSAELNIIEKQETNTKFNYKITLSQPDSVAFFGFRKKHWKGWVNDQKASLKWKDKDQIILDLPAGTHDISFKYADKRQSFLWGIFWLGLLLAFAYLLTFNRFDRQGT